MRPRISKTIAARTVSALFITALLCGLGGPSHAASQAKQHGAESTPKPFNTAEDAVKALVEAADRYDVPKLLEILGSDGQDLVASEGPADGKIRASAFVALAREKTFVATDSSNRHAELTVGKDNWPFPIPIVQRSGKWYFDTKAGRQEILFRRIGENELNAIQICRGFVEAEHEYASEKHDGSGVNQYAQRIISTTGQHDGLAWQNADGSWAGPVGEAAAKAMEQGYTSGQPYGGYYFKVLKGQGPAAPLGEMDFAVNGIMIGGFALIAAPAQYRVNGVKTFMVSHEGIVYEKDLGPDTLTIFKNTERYNPDKTWHRTDDGS